MTRQQWNRDQLMILVNAIKACPNLVLYIDWTRFEAEAMSLLDAEEVTDLLRSIPGIRP